MLGRSMPPDGPCAQKEAMLQLQLFFSASHDITAQRKSIFQNPAIFIQLLLLEECILHSACAGCLREQECFLGSYLSPFFHFCLLLSFTNNKNEKSFPVSCGWRILTVCDPVKASVVLTSESSCWFFPSVFDHKQGEWWCCVWVWGSYVGVDLCDPVLQTSFVAPLFCDLGQESSHKDICIKYIGSWFCLYHVRSCLMNNHQEKGDVLDLSSTETFGISPENVSEFRGNPKQKQCDIGVTWRKIFGCHGKFLEC